MRPNRKGSVTEMSKKVRHSYGFEQFNRGDAWRYYGVPVGLVRNAAKMFGVRHGKKFRVQQDAKAVLVERVA